MKYGDTLQQRSTPLWETYNIDYNDIKHLIKVRTTKGQAQATTIPGHENEARALRDFEDELYNELRLQHQRIDLFVQSKSGEIARRLTHLDKQISLLTRRNLSSTQPKISVRRLERFSNAEETILKVGEDIQALSRFVGAQRLAFQKLLKKYKKWTSSSVLGHRFQREVLDQPSSFTKKGFEPLLEQWAEILTAVRAPFMSGTSWQPKSSDKIEPLVGVDDSKSVGASMSNPSPSRHPQDPLPHGPVSESTARDMHSICESGSKLDFDTALAVLPLGSAAKKAVYWVHPDNLIQVHVILLQHTRIHRTNNTAPSSPDTASPRSSRSGSVNSHWSPPNNRADEAVGVIICDDLQQFAKRQSSVTISDSENLPGNTSEKAAASIRYCPTSEAVAVVDKSSETIEKSPSKKHRFEIAKLKTKAIRQLFSSDPRLSFRRKHSCQSGASSDFTDDQSEAIQKLEDMRAWLSEHQEVQPLVHLYMRRIRFIGLRNSEAGGLWATVDKDISMRKFPKGVSTNADDLLTFGEEGKTAFEKFPHALIEIRSEGNIATDLIAWLDESHLIERVRGFSLEAHAVATLCKPQGMPSPYWLPALNQDIRKVPASAKNVRPRTAGSQMSPNSTRTQKTSTSATSVGEGPSGSGFSAPASGSTATSVPDMLQSPPLSAFKKKRWQHTNRLLTTRVNQVPKSQQQRYWNEFDDGDEGSEEEVYTIFVDPNNSSTFPGAVTVSKLFASIAAGVSLSAQKVKSWLGSEPKVEPNEEDSLSDGYRTRPASVEYDSDLEDDLSPDSLMRDPQRRYSTFPNPRNKQARQSRETLLSRFCTASFIASVVLLAIAAVLASTGRRKSAVAVKLGVIVGVIWSLVFAIVGVGTMLARSNNLGWMHRAVVLLILAIICVGNGVSLAASGGS